MIELRCAPKTLHGILDDNGRLEVSCKNKVCGWEPGVAIRHYFNPLSGELIETKKFREPQTAFGATKKEATAPCR